MEKIILQFKKQDIEDFIFRSKKHNPIKKFWISFIKSLPNEFKTEIRSRPTQLVEQGLKNVYVFKTENPSKNLAEQLKTVIIVADSFVSAKSKVM